MVWFNDCNSKTTGLLSLAYSSLYLAYSEKQLLLVISSNTELIVSNATQHWDWQEKLVNLLTNTHFFLDPPFS